MVRYPKSLIPIITRLEMVNAVVAQDAIVLLRLMARRIVLLEMLLHDPVAEEQLDAAIAELRRRVAWVDQPNGPH